MNGSMGGSAGERASCKVRAGGCGLAESESDYSQGYGEIESLGVKRKAGSGTKSEAEETRQAMWAPFFLGKCACCCCHHAWTADSGFFPRLPPVRF